MQARMNNPATILPDAMPAIQALQTAVYKAGVPGKTLALAHLRVSQINGCSVCVDGGIRHAKKAGETDERLHAVAAWRETPYFSDADRPDPVPDDIYQAAAKHFEERALAGLILWIATTNLFNRVNATTRQIAGSQSW